MAPLVKRLLGILKALSSIPGITHSKCGDAVLESW